MREREKERERERERERESIYLNPSHPMVTVHGQQDCPPKKTDRILLYNKGYFQIPISKTVTDDKCVYL